MMLKDKVGIVTGSGSGIGRASAVRCAREGAKLALFDVSEAGLEGTRAEILSSVPTAEVLCLKVDVSSEEEVKNAIDETCKTFGKLDFAHNNAGVSMSPGKVGEVDTKSWERVVHINLFGNFYCAKYEIQHMLKHEGPSSILFTSSVGGLIGTPASSDYVCSKHALIGLAKAICCDYADAGIRANCICPGQIATPMWDTVKSRFAGDPEGFAKFNRSQNPMRRLGRPEEIAAAAVFLLSEESSHIAGVALPVDGAHVASNASYFNWD